MAKKKLTAEDRRIAVSAYLEQPHQPMFTRGLGAALRLVACGVPQLSVKLWTRNGKVHVQTYALSAYRQRYTDDEIVLFRERDTLALKEACTKLGFPYTVT